MRTSELSVLNSGSESARFAAFPAGALRLERLVLFHRHPLNRDGGVLRDILGHRQVTSDSQSALSFLLWLLKVPL
jgi:hypothetical protein